ncbi:MAG: hypothetical protein E7617_02795 [Ruminococcaceae bacterium]|nr:hypothetical protein [Oscillospiraceae bacterium]
MKVFDIIALIIMAIGLILGYKKGFFGSITKPVKLIASVCLTIVISSPIINAWTRPLFVEKVEGWVFSGIMENCPDITAGTAQESLPLVFRLLADTLKLDLSTLDPAATTEEIVALIAEQLAIPVGNFIAVVVTYVALFIILMLLLTVLVALLDAVFTTGWLGKVNRVLGLLLGAVIAAVIVSVIANIIGAFAPGVVSGAISQFFKNLNPFSIIMQIK